MALISKDNIAHGTVLGVWKREEELELLESVTALNTNELKEYNTITNESRKKEWLTTRILLTEILQQKITIGHSLYGKPFLIDHKSNVSISHSRNYVAIIVSSNYQPGVDIEYISSRIEKVKHKFLTPNELGWCLNIDQQTTCWSAKESVFKIFEKELNFHDMETSPFKVDLDSGRFNIKILNRSKESYFVINYRLIENDILTYTTKP